MGCASSSNPLEAAKKAAGGVLDAGEKAINDAGDAITETMDNMADSVVDMKNKVKQRIHGGDSMDESMDESVTAENSMNDLRSDIDESMEHIPRTREDMENMKNRLKREMSEDADEMADELMNDTEMVLNEEDEDLIEEENEQMADTGDVINAMKQEIMTNGKDDVTVEDMENDSTQIGTDNNENTTALSSSSEPGQFQTSFRHFYSVVNSKLKQETDETYKPTAWELLADSVLSVKKKNYGGADEAADTENKPLENKASENKPATSTTDIKNDTNDMSEREKALVYRDRRWN